MNSEIEIRSVPEEYHGVYQIDVMKFHGFSMGFPCVFHDFSMYVFFNFWTW